MTQDPTAYSTTLTTTGQGARVFTLTVTLPAETVELLEVAVTQTSKSRDWIVNQALQLWLAALNIRDEEDDQWLSAWHR